GIRMAIGDVAVHEGNEGTRVAVFNVTLSKPALGTVTVSFATGDGTAIAPGDYTAKSGTLSFAPGVQQLSVKVIINADTMIEGDESFAVNLSVPVGATFSDPVGAGTIFDDDGAL
ncbi:MAG: Calx-beta domain-containing protein, partial [Acidimicrobiales bacterium]